MIDTLLSLDGNILLFIQEYIRNPILDPIVTAITRLGDGGMIWIALSIFLLLFKRTRRVGIISICALLGSLLINNMLLKNLVARVRPYDAVEGLTILVKKPGEFSFPSGHAASSFSAAFAMYRRLPKKFGIPILLLAVCIGLSRLYVCVHYPTDVLAGVFSGFVISCLAGRLVDLLWPDQQTAECQSE